MGRRTGRLTPAKLCSDVQLNCKKSAEVIVAKKNFFAKDRTIIVLKTKGRRSNAKTTENGESRLPLRGYVGNR